MQIEKDSSSELIVWEFQSLFWHGPGVAVLTVDSLGRRPLLLGGVGAMVVALCALGASQISLVGELETWTSVGALLLYVGAYQVRGRAQGLRRPCLCIFVVDFVMHGSVPLG